jgi:transketolase
MTEERKMKLELVALKVREHCVRMATDGGCFLGASLSCTDLIVYLYHEILDTTPERTKDPNRDYFFLSKGHDVPALYGTLAERGYFDRERLRNHLSTSDSIYWHPNRAIPGVEFHAGSLGHLLSVAIGVAYDLRIRRQKNRVYVLMGDGELNEGSVWESALVAAAACLDNLVVIVDRNEFQANVRTEDLTPLEPIDKKFASFGWGVQMIGGHKFEEMESAFSRIPLRHERPTAIVAQTIRGKGLPSIERRADRWFTNFTHEEVEMLLAELHGQTAATISSPSQIVR